MSGCVEKEEYFAQVILVLEFASSCRSTYLRVHWGLHHGQEVVHPQQRKQHDGSLHSFPGRKNNFFSSNRLHVLLVFFFGNNCE